MKKVSKLSRAKTGKTGTGIIVMAYNEEKNLGPALDGLLREVPKVTDDFEILVIDDGSDDSTGNVADKYGRKSRHIRVVHHRENRGFGRSFRSGVSLTRKRYVVGFPGDNDTSPASLAQLVRRANDRTVVTCYPTDLSNRSAFRHLISKSFVVLMNAVFRMNLKYFNGSFIYLTEAVKNLNLKSDGFAIYAEAKVRLRHLGYPFEEIPFIYTGRKHGTSKAVTGKSVRETLETIITLVKDIYLKKRINYSN
ncbi:hypothetical protein A2Z33_04035 [Candidatus Gottesmanbacteria bacterium RBG_16_52_11]|uniref:Glycosyltransferase 2-like domain-containing protein n=1 Tax=Candidatus Gottesmanbacteria bacterium RBG_16_52_11 TaxID=1798374 RepID=A0A1F5YWL0_9BACT|nr:MAG: hypothetical protein A2Z33_04035 [Candidatus Gottesmanbacteria bacterium RBG_16_52_11]